MSPAPSSRVSAAAFAGGVFFYFMAPAVPHVVSPGPETTRLLAFAAGTLVSLAMAMPAFLGSWLAFRASVRAPAAPPPLLAAAVGLAFAAAVEPGLRALSQFGVDMPLKPLGTMLAVATVAGLIAAGTAAIASAVRR